MRREKLTLPILVSFNELAWIAVFALVMLYSVETNRLKADRDTVARERDTAKREKEEVAHQLVQTRKELENARHRLANVVINDTVLNQQLVGLKGDLRRVIFIVDRSGSMNNGGRWEHARDVIRTWLERLPIEQCALITFNDNITIYPPDRTFLDIVGPAGQNNRVALLEQLKSLKPQGETNTLSALQKAYEYPDLSTIILFTDGCPASKGIKGCDTVMAEQIYALCQAHGQTVPINTVGLGSYFDKQFGEFLLRLPRETGGTFLGR